MFQFAKVLKSYAPSASLDFEYRCAVLRFQGEFVKNFTKSEGGHACQIPSYFPVHRIKEGKVSHLKRYDSRPNRVQATLSGINNQ